VYIEKCVTFVHFVFKDKEGDILEESKIESYLKKRVSLIGGKAYKFVSPGVTGVPDRIVLLPGGSMYFVELKAPGKVARPIQLHRKKEIEKLGFKVKFIDSKDSVDKFIERVVKTWEVK